MDDLGVEISLKLGNLISIGGERARAGIRSVQPYATQLIDTRPPRHGSITGSRSGTTRNPLPAVVFGVGIFPLIVGFVADDHENRRKFGSIRGVIGRGRRGRRLDQCINDLVLPTVEELPRYYSSGTLQRILIGKWTMALTSIGKHHTKRRIIAACASLEGAFPSPASVLGDDGEFYDLFVDVDAIESELIGIASARIAGDGRELVQANALCRELLLKHSAVMTSKQASAVEEALRLLTV